MNFLLDTHTLIWFILGDNKLSENSRKLIIENTRRNFVSIASFWEMAIKINLNRLELNSTFEEFIEKSQENNFEILPISVLHTSIISQLPLHHRDPFDRMILAQAISKDLTIITKDENFHKYDVKLVW